MITRLLTCLQFNKIRAFLIRNQENKTIDNQTAIPTDEELVKAYRADPAIGFDMLYRTMADRLSTYVRRAFLLNPETVADVVHDAFLPWVEDPTRMMLVLNPRSYLYSSAKYQAIARKKSSGKLLSLESSIKSDQPELSDRINSAVDIEKELACLPDDQREAVVLKIWGEMTLEEIAAVQGVSLPTTASRYRYALQKLKEKLTWEL